MAYNYVLSFILCIMEFGVTLSSNKELLDLGSKWVLDSIGKLSVMQILKGMRLIEVNPHMSKLDEEVLGRLQNYNWIDDPNAPLGLSQIIEDRLDLFKALTPHAERMDLVRDELEICYQMGMTDEFDNVIILKRMMKSLLD